MDFRSPVAQQRYADVVAAAARGVVCLDFDGVLAPIVEDPGAAYIHPDAAEVLPRLGAGFRAIAVVTGRPARQAIELGRLEDVGGRILAAGGDLLVRGQYGNERWDARQGGVESPEPPAGLTALRAELPELLAAAGAPAAFVEDKGLAVAVHTRRLTDPQEALERVGAVLSEAATRHGLALEPGRLVLEVRAPGTDKGHAVQALRDELGAEAVVYVGDDLGDVKAFEAVAAMRESGTAGLLVCSGSAEQEALVDHSDLVVPGPDGVMELLRRLADDAGHARGAGGAGGAAG